jgi:hypothetical protein
VRSPGTFGLRDRTGVRPSERLPAQRITSGRFLEPHPPADQQIRDQAAPGLLTEELPWQAQSCGQSAQRDESPVHAALTKLEAYDDLLA